MSESMYPSSDVTVPPETTGSAETVESVSLTPTPVANAVPVAPSAPEFESTDPGATQKEAADTTTTSSSGTPSQPEPQPQAQPGAAEPAGPSGFQKLASVIKENTPSTQRAFRDASEYAETSGWKKLFKDGLARLNQVSVDTKQYLDDKGVTSKAQSVLLSVEKRIEESGLRAKTEEVGSVVVAHLSVVGKAVEVQSNRAADYLADKIQESIPKKKSVSVVVPPDSKEGDPISVTLENGDTIEIILPPGSQPGSTLVVQY